MTPYNSHLTMRERLIKAVTDQRNLMGSVDGMASVVRILHDESAERIVDAVLLELRDPDAMLIVAGGDVPDSVQRFWPVMIDSIRGATTPVDAGAQRALEDQEDNERDSESWFFDMDGKP